MTIFILVDAMQASILIRSRLIPDCVFLNIFNGFNVKCVNGHSSAPVLLLREQVSPAGN